MGVGLHYTINGDTQVEHDLLGLGARAIEPRPVLELIAEQLRGIERELFDTEGKGTWAPLAASTIARKGNDRILVDQGALMKSLTEQSGGDHFEVIQRTELFFGTSDPKAGFHKTGTSKMPARDPLKVDEVDMKRFSKAFQIYLMGSDRASFGVGDFGMTLTEPFGP